MTRVPMILRLLLGLAFTIFGLNFFLHFLPQPAPPAKVIAFMVPFMTAHYMGLVKVIEISCGLLLLANRFVPLALALLAPVLVGILQFHIALEPSGLPLPLVLIALELALVYFYRDAFKPMLRAVTAPS